MKTRTLGKDGPEIGEIGLGCMNFSGMYGPSTDEISHETLRTCLDIGVTHLDTANIYGMGASETTLGAFIKDHPNRFTIATKAGIKRGRQQDLPVEDVMGTLMKFIDEGKIGSIGFSEISPATLRRAAAAGPVRAVQSEYSLWTRNGDLGMIQACEEVGAGMFGEKPLDPGTFLDGDIRKGNPRFSSENFPFNLAYFDKFRALAKELDTKPATLAIAWVLAQSPINIPIPGTRTSDHLRESAAASAFDYTPEVAARIDAIMPAGFAHGDRYSTTLINGVERIC